MQYVDWKAVSVGQFVKAREALYMANKLDKMLHVVGVFENLKGPVMDMDMDKLNKAANRWLPVLDTLPQSKVVKKTKVNGTRYYFNAVVSKFTAGQFIDAKTLLGQCVNEDGTLNEDKLFARLPKILAVFSLEKGGKYPGNFEARVKDMGDLSMDVAYPVSAFFLRAWPILTELLNQSLADQAREATAMVKDLLKSGDGLSHLTPSQIQTLHESTSLLDGLSAGSSTRWRFFRRNRRRSIGFNK